jgi:hypothetical protein
MVDFDSQVYIIPLSTSRTDAGRNTSGGFRKQIDRNREKRMTNLRLVFRRPGRTSTPTPSEHPPENHLRLIHPAQQLNPFDEGTKLQAGEEIKQIWAFCANIDQLALRNTREDIGIGFFSFIQDFFRALPLAEGENVKETGFTVWVDGSPTYRKPPTGASERPFWMLYLAAERLPAELVAFVRSYIASQVGWKEIGWVSRIGQDTLPMFQYRQGEPVVFFTRIRHPNGAFSLGHPDIFYKGNELFLGFGGVPRPMKRAVLRCFLGEPLAFTVRMMDEILPGFVASVDADLTTHPCGYTEQELIARCTDWDLLTEKDRSLIRKYGPPE